MCQAYFYTNIYVQLVGIFGEVSKSIFGEACNTNGIHEKYRSTHNLIGNPSEKKFTWMPICG